MPCVGNCAGSHHTNLSLFLSLFLAGNVVEFPSPTENYTQVDIPLDGSSRSYLVADCCLLFHANNDTSRNAILIQVKPQLSVIQRACLRHCSVSDCCVLIAQSIQNSLRCSTLKHTLQCIIDKAYCTTCDEITFSGGLNQGCPYNIHLYLSAALGLLQDLLMETQHSSTVHQCLKNQVLMALKFTL